MAADYERYLYEDDLGQTHAIRLSKAGGDAQGATASTAAATGSPVQSRRNGRQQTLQVRGLRLTRIVGTPPNNGIRTTFLPILTVEDYNGFSKGDAVTIGTTSYTVGKKLGEANNR